MHCVGLSVCTEEVAWHGTDEKALQDCLHIHSCWVMGKMLILQINFQVLNTKTDMKIISLERGLNCDGSVLPAYHVSREGEPQTRHIPLSETLEA